jgi:hypothetical protein
LLLRLTTPAPLTSTILLLQCSASKPMMFLFPFQIPDYNCLAVD